MKIVVDAMGGDEAPKHIIDGVILAARAWVSTGANHEIILTGDKDVVMKEIERCGGRDLCGNILRLEHTTSVIDMHESPADAWRNKSGSSIHRGAELVKSGQADAFIGMGNTGAMMTAGLLGVGRIEGVQRPTIGAFFPTARGRSLVLDVGAVSDCKPQHLLQFGLMGSIYMEAMWGVKNPTVGLLSIGEEDSKGNEVTKETNALFREKKLFNFAGNVEGRDILKGTTDVIVCDGFVGNIVLKFGESVPGFLKVRFKQAAESSFMTKLQLLLAKTGIKGVFKDMNYEEYGGVPLLGVNGVVIIGHGSSSPKAMYNAIMVAQKMVDKKINEVIKERIRLS